MKWNTVSTSQLISYIKFAITLKSEFDIKENKNKQYIFGGSMESNRVQKEVIEIIYAAKNSYKKNTKDDNVVQKCLTVTSYHSA